MNILYITSVASVKSSGPYYSVPRRINAQSKYDNVLWVNFTELDNEAIIDKTVYMQMKYTEFRLDKLPEPFRKPDLVVFEEFFKIDTCLVARYIKKKKIPYVIVPRSQMTEMYFKRKKYKKLLARIIMFDYFAKHAASVQFLTEEEEKDSRKYYKGRSFVVSNGITVSDLKANINSEVCKGVFVGRYNIWQKGLDIFAEAVSICKKELVDNRISFDMYGPTAYSSSIDEVQKVVKEYGIEDVVNINDAAFGERKKEVLLDASFFVHTSRFEGMSMSILEALSYGLPCLVTEGTNIRKQVEAYDAGWGAETTVDGVVKALKELINTKNKFYEKSSNAKELAKQYSWDRLAIKCQSEYKELIGCTGGSTL